jgi:hypothetical protein
MKLSKHKTIKALLMKIQNIKTYMVYSRVGRKELQQ